MKDPIIVDADEELRCPECGHEFALRDGISSHTVDQYRAQHEAWLTSARAELQASAEKRAERELTRRYDEQLEKLREDLAARDAAAARLKAAIAEEREQAAATARQELASRQQELERELTDKNAKITALQTQELELRRAQKALEEQGREMELQIQRRVDEQVKQARTQLDEVVQLRDAERRKQLDDALKANAELKRKLEQGSQQLQGEVLELEIEALLEQAFPLDRVDPVGKGQRGADVRQTVMTRSGTACGELLWEMKRAQNWSQKWVDKLKADQREAGAEVAILVTTAFPLPSDEQFIFHEDIWITRPAAVRSLALALRAGLIESQRQKLIVAGRDEKMSQLYDYLCSPQFAQRVRAVVDTYEQMKRDLDRERAAMERLWKKRETQLGAMTSNMMNLTGEIQAIAQDGVPLLGGIGELDDGADDEAPG